MNWIIIAALVILAFVFLRMSHVKHKVYLMILLFVLLFVYVTGSRIFDEHDLDLKSVEGVGQVLKVYFSWLGSVKDNFKDVAANVIKIDWKLNETES